MATKINTTYYGSEDTFVQLSATQYVKRCAQTVGQLMSGGTYTGGSFDTSASPWGIGKSSASSDFTFVASKGEQWAITFNENERKNTPLYLYWSNSPVIGGNDTSGFAGVEVGPWTYSRALYKNRFSPSANVADSTLISTLTLDNDTRIDITNTVNQYPVTYADYSHLRMVIFSVFYKPVNSNTIARTTMSDIKAGRVNVDKIVSFFFGLYDTSVHGTNLQLSVGGSELTIPEIFKNCYYGNNDKWVRPWRYLGSIGYWTHSDADASVGFAGFNTDSGTAYTTAYETPSADDAAKGNAGSNGWGHISKTPQVYDDVSYHWEYGITPNTGSVWDINPIENGATFASGNYKSFGYMELDDYTGNKNDAYYNAILHEVAFMGFPIVIDGTYLSRQIGDDNVYVPVFDDHVVTTGDFISGSASLDLINAAWTDIFGTTMPEYDPEYEPIPPDPDNDDYGYLDNKPITNRVYSSNNRVYALTAAQYSQFINDVNSLYLDDPNTGYASFQLDFKGTNPSDYIVGTYGYTFLPAGLIPNQTPEAIQIGAVTLPNAKGYKIAPSYIYNYRSLGEIDLTGAGDFKPFGDFRDFEPYTHIELYVPLCGNIELDPAAVIGHTIQIEIIFDIMTGNATACVYRDNKTLISTVAGQLAASLPLTSGRMGDYQNAVKSAENALKQNELKTTTAAATVAIGVGAALLAPETGGLSLAAYGAAITGGASLMSLSNQKNQIEYEIKHKQPSISVCSSANGAVAQNISSMYAVCYVKQCKMLSSYNAATYAHTVGHATVKNTTIGAETTDGGNSLIVCSNADLSGIPATAAEINAIQSLLTGGIYV